MVMKTLALRHPLIANTPVSGSKYLMYNQTGFSIFLEGIEVFSDITVTGLDIIWS